MWDSIDDHIDDLVELEQDIGALLYARMANRAADILDYPEGVKTEVPEDEREQADEFIEKIMSDENEEAAHVLYGMAADAGDLRHEYVTEHGEDNFEPLAQHISRVRSRYEEYRRTHE